jgi:hypothetical protein
MDPVVASIDAEFRRYQALAEAALDQVPDDRLSEPGPGGTNSLAVTGWHISGNLRSRFTDFLTTDGEKPWRHRDEEFVARSVTRAELLAKWNQGWGVLLATLGSLRDADLARSVAIRGRPLSVVEALQRSLAHVSYHVGQMVFLARAIVGSDWKYLSIPPGGSAAYNAAPSHDKPGEQAAAIGRK